MNDELKMENFDTYDIRFVRLCSKPALNKVEGTILLLFPLLLQSAFNKVEKTKPICQCANLCKPLFERNICQYAGLNAAKKQSQSKAILPGFALKYEALNPKSETRRICGGYLKKQSQFSNGQNDVNLMVTIV